jgi:hypothetical protein
MSTALGDVRRSDTGSENSDGHRRSRRGKLLQSSWRRGRRLYGVYVGWGNLGILTHDGILSINGDNTDISKLFGFIAQVVEITGEVMKNEDKASINVHSIGPVSAR